MNTIINLRKAGGILLTTLGLLIAGCSGNSASEAGSANAPTALEEVSASKPATEAVDPDNIPTDIEVCGLLTNEQVATVLPGHEGGLEAASGKSLFGNSRSYKCSYDVEQPGNEVHFFTIDLTAGPDAVMFFESGRAMAREENDILREVEIADGGYVTGGPGYMGGNVPYLSVTVLKDSIGIDLLLIVPDADKQVDAVIALASAMVSKLG